MKILVRSCFVRKTILVIGVFPVRPVKCSERGVKPKQNLSGVAITRDAEHPPETVKPTVMGGRV